MDWFPTLWNDRYYSHHHIKTQNKLNQVIVLQPNQLNHPSEQGHFNQRSEIQLEHSLD